jgi:hypothetical protein
VRRRARAAEDARGARRSARDTKTRRERSQYCSYLAELERLGLAPNIIYSRGLAVSEMGVLKYNGVPASERRNTACEIEPGKRDKFTDMNR